MDWDFCARNLSRKWRFRHWCCIGINVFCKGGSSLFYDASDIDPNDYDSDEDMGLGEATSGTIHR